MVTSTKWRINISGKMSGGAWTTLKEIEMRATAGGADQCTGGVASASANNGGANPASNAFDNSAATSWTTGTTALPQWIEYDFPGAVAVEEIYFLPASASDTPTDFTVEYWDGSAWQVHWTEIGIAWPSTSFRLFSSYAGSFALARKWRMRITDTVGGVGNWIGLRELQIRATGGGADQTNPAPTDGAGPFASANLVDANLVFDDTAASYGAGSAVRPVYIGFYFATPVACAQISVTGPPTAGDAPKDFTFDYWNGTAWVTALTQAGLSWTGGEIKLFSITAPTNLQASQGQFLASVMEWANLRVAQGGVLAAASFPAKFMKASQAQIHVAYKAAMKVRASQAQVLVAGRGRIANPRLRAWTFSMDGHDFYVLRLGDTLTLVFDLTSEQWVDWGDLNQLFWRPNMGINWSGGTALANTYGSNVLVGDDTFGLLWFLDPDQPYDQHPDSHAPVQEKYFDRITMGQYPIRGRESISCYAAWLTTDMGNPAYPGASVTLSISDDAGQTFFDMGAVAITAGVFTPELSWYSLGQISAPGRLFKIVDDGAVARIDGMEMNDPDDNANGR